MNATTTKNLLFNLVAGAATLLALGSSPAAAWELPVYLSDYGVTSYSDIKIVIDGKGRAVAAWDAYSGVDETFTRFLQVAIRPAGGVFGPATTLSSLSADVYGFDIAASKKGTVTAVWDRGVDYDNRWLEVSDLGKKDLAFGSPTVFSPAGQPANWPQIGLDKKGNATVLWIGQTSGIVSSATRKVGDPFGPAEVLSGGGNYNAVLAVGPKGNAVAAWSSEPEPNTVEAAIRPEGGTFAEPIVISDPTKDTDLIQIAMDAKGNASICARNFMMGDISADGVASEWFNIPFDRQTGAVIKWDKAGNQYAFYTSYSYRAYLAVRPAGSTTFGAPIAVSDPALGASARDMIVDKKGNVRVIWTEHDGVYGRVKTAYKPVGGVFDTPVQLSVDGVDSGSGKLAADRKGNITAIWMETDDATSKIRIASSYQPR
jgi:hypothetical protein